MAPSLLICASLGLISVSGTAETLESNTLLQRTKMKGAADVDANLQVDDRKVESRHSKQLAYVEQLASTMATTHTHIDEPAKQALEAIQGTLDTSLETITTAHNTDQDSINSDESVYLGCGSAFQLTKDENANAKRGVDDAESDHHLCRLQEEADHSNMTTMCGDLDTFVENLSPPNCEVPDGDVDLEPYFDRLDSFVDGFKPSYIDHRSKCTEATTTHDDNAVICDGNQRRFEQAGCDLERDVLQACHTYNVCASTARAEFDIEVAAARERETQRQVEWRSIKKIQCYVDKILRSEELTLDDLVPCQELDPDLSPLVLNIPTLPPVEECDFTSIENAPCNDGWTSKYLGLISVETCTPCTALSSALQNLRPTTCFRAKTSSNSVHNAGHLGIQVLDGSDNIIDTLPDQVRASSWEIERCYPSATLKLVVHNDHHNDGWAGPIEVSYDQIQWGPLVCQDGCQRAGETGTHIIVDGNDDGAAYHDFVGQARCVNGAHCTLVPVHARQ